MPISASFRDCTTTGHTFTRTAQICEGLKVQALQSNMRHLWQAILVQGGPWPGSLWYPPIFAAPQALATGVYHHTQLVCWFWVQTQAVVVSQQELHWLSHLLSHLPRSSFWEAFAKSEFGAQVCCNSMRGRCNKKPAGLGKGGSWALAAGKLLHKDCLSEVSHVGTLEPIPEPEGQRICSSED